MLLLTLLFLLILLFLIMMVSYRRRRTALPRKTILRRSWPRFARKTKTRTQMPVPSRSRRRKITQIPTLPSSGIQVSQIIYYIYIYNITRPVKLNAEVDIYFLAHGLYRLAQGEGLYSTLNGHFHIPNSTVTFTFRLISSTNLV